MDGPKAARHYSTGYPLEGWRGSRACDCKGKARGARHELEAKVRIGDVAHLKRAAENGGAVPYFRVASTNPGRDAVALVRGTVGQGTLPGIYVAHDIRRQGRSANADDGLPPLLLMAHQPGKRRRQRQIKSTDQLEPSGSYLRIVDARLSREAWQTARDLSLVGKCPDHEVERDGEVWVELRRANLCSVPVQVRDVEHVHFAYTIAATDEIPPAKDPPPAFEAEEGPDDASAFRTVQCMRLEQVVKVLLPAEWLDRYGKAEDSESRVEVLEQFLREHNGGFSVRGDAGRKRR